MKTKLFILIISFLFLGCNNSKYQKSCSGFYIGQNILLPPDNMYIINSNNDTTKISLLNPSNRD